MNKLLLISLLLLVNSLAISIVATGNDSICNPITKGLNPYGQRDFHITTEGKSYYLVATEMQEPGTEKRGIVLYNSKNLKEWTEIAILIDRNTINMNSWYKDEFKAPEIHKIRGKYYLSFNCNNNTTNPYGQLGVGIAVAENIEGPYKILNPESPLTLGNNFTLFEDTDKKIVAYWDLDGRFYAAQMNPDMKSFKSEPKIVLAQNSINPKDNFLDSPSLIRYKNNYYLLYSVFSGGYRISFATSTQALGPWKAPINNTVFYRSEDQASTTLRMNYDRERSYAPPCEIIGQAQLFYDLKGKLKLAYHSEDKYAEPYLCIDNAQIIDGKVICKPTLK